MAKRRVASAELDRCPWAKEGQNKEYHDHEWGVPVHEDRLLFEFLILEGAQAGLSWTTILQKRDNYRKAFDNFDPAVVAKYSKKKQTELLANAGIGLVGWVAAWVLVTLVSGEGPDEITLGIGLLALVCSIVFIGLLERRARRRAASKGSPSDAA